jgi:hypothetical protein
MRMKTMAWIGAAIVFICSALSIVLTLLLHFDLNVLPIVYYGLALTLTAGFFTQWKRRRLKKSGSTRLKEAEVFTARESVCALILATIPAAIFWGFFTFLGTLSG